jgi:Putative transposase
MRSCSYPYATVLDGIPCWVQSYRLSCPLHGVESQSRPWGLCITPASRGEEFHLHPSQVIKDCIVLTSHPQLDSGFERTDRSVAKYVVSPPISLRRIDYYNGSHVGYHYHSHKTDRVERERVDVYTFISRMVQHGFPKGFKRIRYYGVQATKTFEKVKGLIQEALSKVKGIVKDAIKIIPALT